NGNNNGINTDADVGTNNVGATNTGTNADGYQEIKMDVLASGWSPNKFVLKKGVPVKWIINGKEITGCNNAIQVPKLGLSFKIKPGLQTIEFTPDEEGVISFSCWMGMVSGVIEVVSEDGSSNAKNIDNKANDVIPSGAKGCGCGGGSNIKKDTSNTVAQVQGNTQVINATYTSNNYLAPNAFEVKAGTKVKLTIDVKDSGSGCGSAIKIPGLYENAINLSAGNIINMEFTPTSLGNYDITCGMEMMNFGSIQVN
ncbi:MAG: Heavy metal transport/detoxification protein, partial [Parcubacteria group bacterium GW2011_GWC2_32_10]